MYNIECPKQNLFLVLRNRDRMASLKLQGKRVKYMWNAKCLYLIVARFLR